MLSRNENQSTMKKKIIIAFFGSLAISFLSISDANGICQNSPTTCQDTWWCCNCHGQEGCREVPITIYGFRPVNIE
jgi:hypothetical protein